MIVDHIMNVAEFIPKIYRINYNHNFLLQIKIIHIYLNRGNQIKALRYLFAEICKFIAIERFLKPTQPKGQREKTTAACNSAIFTRSIQL